MADLIRMPTVGERVDGRYELVAQLGRGGHGVVYSARVVEPAPGVEVGDWVAVKMLRPHALDNPTLAARMRQEGELVASLRSPRTVRVYHYGVHEWTDAARGVPFIVCELLEGQTLGELLSKADALAPVQPNEDETDLQLVLQQNSLALRKAEESAKQLAFFER